MSDEKILSYFNIDIGKPLDNFFILLLASMDLGISAFFGLEILFEIISITTISVLIGIVGVAFDVLMMICSKIMKNPILEYPMLFFLSLSSTIKLLINAGFTYFSELTVKEISIGIEYLAFTITAILLAVVVLREKIIALKLLKNNSIEQVREMVSNRKINKWAFPASCIPGGTMFLYRMLRGRIDFSITFCCWALASVSLFFVFITGYNFVVALRLNLFQVYKRN